MLGSGHEQAPDPQTRRSGNDRNVGNVTKFVERLQEREASRFSVVFSYDGFAPCEPLRRDGWTFSSSGQSPAERANGCAPPSLSSGRFQSRLQPEVEETEIWGSFKNTIRTALLEIGTRCQA